MILSILICEDNESQRKSIEKIISAHTKIKEYDCKVVLSTDSPYELLAHIEEVPAQNNFYILDVNLKSDINGIVLGQKIREIDPFGVIIFVTSHSEHAMLTFKHRVSAMDYIIKDNMQSISKKICDCVDIAYRQYVGTLEYFQLKTIDGVRNILVSSILFFESFGIPHKLTLYTKNERIEFRGNLKDIEQMQPFFFRSHKSFVVNIRNVKTVNRTTNEIIMSNDEIALVTPKKTSKLLEMLGKL